MSLPLPKRLLKQIFQREDLPQDARSQVTDGQRKSVPPLMVMHTRSRLIAPEMLEQMKSENWRERVSTENSLRETKSSSHHLRGRCMCRFLQARRCQATSRWRLRPMSLLVSVKDLAIPSLRELRWKQTSSATRSRLAWKKMFAPTRQNVVTRRRRSPRFKRNGTYGRDLERIRPYLQNPSR